MNQSRPLRTERGRRRAQRASLVALLPALVLVLAGCARALPEPVPLGSFVGTATGFTREDVPELLDLAETVYRRQGADNVVKASDTWQAAAAADLTRSEGLAGMARAGVWLTEHLKDPKARLEAATRAVQAAQWCGRITPSDAACDYWLGAALGVKTRENPATGLKALPIIEEAFQRAAERDPGLEEGGPDRALALLYLRAPAWPTGPGDPERGLEHARKAAALSPDYAPNQLALGEALAAAGDSAASRAAYERALAIARSAEATAGREAADWIREASKALGSETGPRPVN